MKLISDELLNSVLQYIRATGTGSVEFGEVAKLYAALQELPEHDEKEAEDK